MMVVLLRTLAETLESFVAASQKPKETWEVMTFPTQGLLPKHETLADRLLSKYPQYDGRNTVVAIFDTGVDPGAIGLQATSDGKPKIIDLIDATGAGDVDTSHTIEATTDEHDHKCLALPDGRVLRLNAEWKPSADNTYHVGMVAGYDIFPKGLVTRMKKTRKEAFDIEQRKAINEVQHALTAITKDHKAKKKELDARLAVLKELETNYQDPGPVYDCVVFNDGINWRAALTTTSDFTGIAAMTDYKIEYQYGTFCAESQLNYGINIYDDGNTLSIVIDAGAHGTHVAGIVAAYHPNQPECNGVAPGAQIISVKIGDTRLGSMETPAALSRAILQMMHAKVDVVNMSYGEYAAEHNAGRIVELAQELVDQHNVVYVCSAGNNGPALGTVGALGGTSSAPLAIGAYVSPQMMEAEYVLRDSTSQSAIAYTWTSRGPTFDGDLGVNLCAPGAAIAPVPNWTLNKKQLMNGTSMASPNAAGNIALLISGLKDQGVAYTPYSIRRALDHTAVSVKNVEVFAQGQGLIQVLPAFEYMVQHGNAFDGTRATPLHYEITTTHANGGKGRGIFLRDAVDFTHENTEVTVSVTPVFHKKAAQEDKIKFEMHLRLVPTERWIDLGRHVALMHEGRAFKVRIDTRNLSYGEHYAEIQALDASSSDDRNPVFIVPVTIIKPEPVSVTSAHVRMEHKLKAGQIVRRFVTPPANATWADVVLSRPMEAQVESNASAKVFMFHAIQFEPFARQSDSEFKKALQLRPGEQATYSFRIIGGLTIECCLAQFWSALGDACVHVDVRFRGIMPDQQVIQVTGGQDVQRVMLWRSIVDSPATLAPQVQFKKWIQRLRPIEGGVITPLKARDQFPEDERQVFQLILKYEFTLKDKGTVAPRLPAFHDRLYESPFEGHMCMVFDAKKQYIGCADAYDEEVAITKSGKYTVLAQVRHENIAKLETLKHTMLFLEHSLSSEITAPVYAHQDDAVLGKKPIDRLHLPLETHIPVFVGEPSIDKLPNGHAPGDLLAGRIFFGKKDDVNNGAGAGRRPGGFEIQYVIPLAPVADPKPSNSVEEKDERSEQEKTDEAVRDLLLARVQKLIGNQTEFDAAHKRLLDQYPDHLPVLQARLHHLDYQMDGTKRSTAQLNDVVSAADAVLAKIDPEELAKYFGKRILDQDKSKKDHQERERTKQIWIDALQRKARALGELHAWDAFDPVFVTLQQWIDTETNDASLPVILLQYRRNEEHGLALQRLLKAKSALEKTEDKKIAGWNETQLAMHVQETLATLGWHHWQTNDQRWRSRQEPSGGYRRF